MQQAQTLKTVEVPLCPDFSLYIRKSKETVLQRVKVAKCFFFFVFFITLSCGRPFG